MCKYKHCVINVIDIVRHWNSLSLLLKRSNTWKIPKENRGESPCHCREKQHKDATYQVPPMGLGPHCWEGWLLPVSHRGKDQPPFLPPGQAVGCGPGRSLAASLAQSSPFSSLTASAEGVEGAGMFSTDSVQIFQDFKLAGLRIGPGTPQELVASRTAVRHLPVL